MRRRHRWGWGYEDAVIGADEAAAAAEHLPATLGFAAQELEEPGHVFALPEPQVRIAGASWRRSATRRTRRARSTRTASRTSTRSARSAGRYDHAP